MPSLVQFPTLDSECNDTERRSLQKINTIQSRIGDALASLNRPGAAQVAFTNFVYGTSFIIPTGADLLDISVYNQTDVDVWVYVMITPGAVIPGMPPTFPIRVYAHNHAYYEAMVAATSVPAGRQFSIAVSANETTLTWNSTPVYLAIRHS
jgi:hypothetical protein